MLTCIGKFFATFTEVFTAVHIIAKVGTRYAEQFELEADHQLAIKRDTLNKQLTLQLAAE